MAVSKLSYSYRSLVRISQNEQERIEAKITEKRNLTDGPTSAYDRLRPFAGVVDSGGLQLSTQTGRNFLEGLLEKSAKRV